MKKKQNISDKSGVKRKSKVRCECSPPRCKDIEHHIKKLRALGEDDEQMIEMIRTGEMRSKILKRGERED
jgi:hypothetical protein